MHKKLIFVMLTLCFFVPAFRAESAEPLVVGQFTFAFPRDWIEIQPFGNRSGIDQGREIRREWRQGREYVNLTVHTAHVLQFSAFATSVVERLRAMGDVDVVAKKTMDCKGHEAWIVTGVIVQELTPGEFRRLAFMTMYVNGASSSATVSYTRPASDELNEDAVRSLYSLCPETGD